MSNELKKNIIFALDVADLPQALQENVIQKAIEGIFQSLMFHAFSVLPVQKQQILMDMLDKDEKIETIFSFLEKNIDDIGEVAGRALQQYLTV